MGHLSHNSFFGRGDLPGVQVCWLCWSFYVVHIYFWAFDPALTFSLGVLTLCLMFCCGCLLLFSSTAVCSHERTVSSFKNEQFSIIWFCTHVHIGCCLAISSELKHFFLEENSSEHRLLQREVKYWIIIKLSK